MDPDGFKIEPAIKKLMREKEQSDASKQELQSLFNTLGAQAAQAQELLKEVRVESSTNTIRIPNITATTGTYTTTNASGNKLPPKWYTDPNNVPPTGKIKHKNFIGLDFETYCELNLKEVGIDRYTSHPSFQVLIGSMWDGVDGTELDFVFDGFNSLDRLKAVAEDPDLVFAAHNAQFERRCLKKLGITPANELTDSAVVSRINGGDSSLANAAEQLLDESKDGRGERLIRKYCVPLPDGSQPEYDEMEVDWTWFQDYCNIDAQLSYKLAEADRALKWDAVEWENERITQRMNERGWPVDMDLVHKMQERFEQNKAVTLQLFQEKHDPNKELNFNSTQQLQRWCRERGVVATSFDKDAVPRLIKSISRKLESLDPGHAKYDGYQEVLALVQTKKELGSPTLSKLQKIVDTVGDDGRLRYQYMHAGAAQTRRCSARGVQMQNLKKMKHKRNVEELFDDSIWWSNNDMAENLRQVFRAEDPDGEIIVGDFSSIESRGLAYLAGADWKLDIFRKGGDIYKVQARKMMTIDPAVEVSDSERQTGKIGELSCGYGAGPGAVQSFALGYGIEYSEVEAGYVVSEWRRSNPEVVAFWELLDRALKEILKASVGAVQFHPIAHQMQLRFELHQAPASLHAIHAGAKSIYVYLLDSRGQVVLWTPFHGVYERDRSICFYKASSNKGGAAWSKGYMHPKTNKFTLYSIYGGKLTGILTQAFCREIFYDVLRNVQREVDKQPELEIIGQFHDEIGVEYTPAKKGLSLPAGAHTAMIQAIMEAPHPRYPWFPINAVVKYDRRYTK